VVIYCDIISFNDLQSVPQSSTAEHALRKVCTSSHQLQIAVYDFQFCRNFIPENEMKLLRKNLECDAIRSAAYDVRVIT